MFLHSWYHFTHSQETWADIFTIPVLQLLVFVFIAKSLSGNNDQGTAMIMGMIFWNIIGVGQYAIVIGALWEIWSKSLGSLFMTPLTLEEFLVGQMLSGFVKSLLAFAVTAGIGWYYYQFSVWDFGPMLLVYYLQLLVFSWAAGMAVLSLVFRYGTDVQSLTWSIIYLIQPLGGVFYPVAVLPASVQWVAWSLPISYVFEAMRRQLASGFIDWPAMAWAGGLNLIWLVAAYCLLRVSVQYSKKTGMLARMES